MITQSKWNYLFHCSSLSNFEVGMVHKKGQGWHHISWPKASETQSLPSSKGKTCFPVEEKYFSAISLSLFPDKCPHPLSCLLKVSWYMTHGERIEKSWNVSKEEKREDSRSRGETSSVLSFTLSIWVHLSFDGKYQSDKWTNYTTCYRHKHFLFNERGVMEWKATESEESIQKRSKEIVRLSFLSPQKCHSSHLGIPRNSGEKWIESNAGREKLNYIRDEILSVKWTLVGRNWRKGGLLVQRKVIKLRERKNYHSDHDRLRVSFSWEWNIFFLSF